jgi:hypothetical protein
VPDARGIAASELTPVERGASIGVVMRRLLPPLAAVAALLLAPARIRGADHADGPALAADPSTDITDLYAWMTPDGRVNLVMDVFPSATAGARFSTSALYVFHLAASSRIGDPAPNADTIVCRFDAQQLVSCWGPGRAYVHGDAGAATGIASAGGAVRVFAGPRDDPFFFNLDGFKTAVGGVTSGLPMDPGGCPTQLLPVAQVARNALASGRNGGPPSDAFAKGGSAGGGSYSGNVLAIVISVDKGLLVDDSHPLLGVWASTNRAQ